MRQSYSIGKTLKEAPKEAVTSAHQLMLRAGYIKQAAAGVYAIMPVLARVLDKIKGLIRREMQARGHDYMILPVLQPQDFWTASGRWDTVADDVDGWMFTFRDRRSARNCLGPAFEEAVLDLVARNLDSYKLLPKKLFQFQTVFSDNQRPRFGLIQAREYMVLDAFSLDADAAGLEAAYGGVLEAFGSILDQIGLSGRYVMAEMVFSDLGQGHIIIVPSEVTEQSVLLCDSCSYAAAQEASGSRLEEYPQDEEPKLMETVYGPGLIGVEPLAEFLSLPVWLTTKTLIFQADEKVVAVMVRGDCDVDEIKVRRHLNCFSLKLASAEIIKELTGAEVGYAGPVGLPSEVRVLADHFTRDRINFECGANQTDYHNINVNFGRDFPWPEFGDFKLAQRGHGCPCCAQGRLQERQGLEIGRLVKNGSAMADRMGAAFLGKDGRPKPFFLGSFRLALNRLAAAVIEQNHDQAGPVWPEKIAPYLVHLLALNPENNEVGKTAERLYKNLVAENIDVLFDDRGLRAGEKFQDADLIGAPVRLTVSKRTCQEDKVEFKIRGRVEKELISYEQALVRIKEFER